ncbi:uncharacterized protein N7469_007125 [Penicillium citrinum]|uniref:Uncharacterized protein n=2 Tax=Penicillium TaxID=5073 RepID=A0A9W9TLM5_PENCI|nr:uncharacterized protein N7469_007125 [Penicillium citrinum]KAJ5227119.1 hypothetical protein N7469_007125 [Penicillium citrinum]KAK5791379.1 hypothetical protein VI817_006688 [Penicillium citrinum]
MANYCYQQPASSTGSQWFSPNANVFNQPTNMQDWARVFPRPRLTRVMKPRSAGNSPSSVGRRRTTVAQGAMQGVSNQYQSSLEAALLASAARDSRPISWHPSSTNRNRGLSNPSYVPDLTPDMYSGMGGVPDQMNAFPVYGSDNMMPYSMATGPAYSPSYDNVYSNPMQTMSQLTPGLSMPGSHAERMAWDVSTTNSDFPNMADTTSDGWSLDMLSMANVPPAATNCPSYASVPSPGEVSGPSTPDFLPIQQFEDAPSTQPKKQGKAEDELIGMGLYNKPDRSLAQAQPGSLGKGLKLEETFSPSEDEKDEDAEDADEESDMQSSQQASPEQPMSMMQTQFQPQQQQIPKQSSKYGLNLLHKSFFFDNDDLDQQPMPMAQPFANFNQSCMNYGYAGWI